MTTPMQFPKKEAGATIAQNLIGFVASSPGVAGALPGIVVPAPQGWLV
jgi:hypothetical protein